MAGHPAAAVAYDSHRNHRAAVVVVAVAAADDSRHNHDRAAAVVAAHGNPGSRDLYQDHQGIAVAARDVARGSRRNRLAASVGRISAAPNSSSRSRQQNPKY